MKKMLSYWTIPVQRYLACICCLTMIIGFQSSRGILSVAMIIMFVNALHPQMIRETWLRWKQSRFALFCVLFFLSYLISGLWSDNGEDWLRVLQQKLPFLVLPFAFMNAPLQEYKYRKTVILCILFALVPGMIYSLSYLVANPLYIKLYVHLPSPVEGDYIRFTTTLVLGLHLALYLLLEQKAGRITSWERIFLVLWSILSIAYIHIQAAKSGLLCFYLLALLYTVTFLWKRHKGLLIGLLGLMGSGAIIMAYTLPSVKKQVKQVAFEYKVWQTRDTSAYNYTSSFVPRLLSYEVALNILAQKPFTGVGAGDLYPVIRQRYIEHYPNLIPFFRLVPHNQFICTALMVGIPLSCSLFIMVFSAVHRLRRYFFPIVNLCLMIISLIIEAMLEVQYGVFVYLFFTLFWISVYRYEKKSGNIVEEKDI
jgi:O-antigen ligase